MALWQTLLALAFTQASLLALAVYVAKAIFAQLLVRDSENHKHQLSRDLAQFKRNLDALQFERQTKFSWAHERQADVIANLYGKLADTHRKIAELTHPMQFAGTDKDGQRKVAAEAYNSLFEYFVMHRVFLSEKLAEQAQSIIDVMRLAFNEFEYAQGRIGGGDIDHKAWIEAWKHIDKEVPVILSALRREFRAALGVAE